MMPRPQYTELVFPVSMKELPSHGLDGYVIVSDGEWGEKRHLFLRKVDAPVPQKRARKAKGSQDTTSTAA